MDLYQKSRKLGLEILDLMDGLEPDEFFVVSIAALEMCKNAILQAPSRDFAEEVDDATE